MNIEQRGELYYVMKDGDIIETFICQEQAKQFVYLKLQGQTTIECYTNKVIET